MDKKLEKCPRFEKAAKILKNKRGLTEIDCIRLREKLFEDFVESIMYSYLEIDTEKLIKHIKNQANRSDHRPTDQTEDGNAAH